MTDSLLLWALGALAVVIVGASKSGLGGGLGVLGVPLLSLATSPDRAAAILLPLLLVMDGQALWHFRGQWRAAELRRLLPAAALGIAVGALSYRHLDPGWLQVLVAVIALGFSAHYFLARWRRRSARPAATWSAWPWGALAGLTSFSAHAGGPPLNAYLLRRQLPRFHFVGTTVVFFAAVNVLKLVPYGWLGWWQPANLWLSLSLLPLAPLGIWLGRHGLQQLSGTLFYTLCYLALAATGTKLLFDGLRSLGALNGLPA